MLWLKSASELSRVQASVSVQYPLSSRIFLQQEQMDKCPLIFSHQKVDGKLQYFLFTLNSSNDSFIKVFTILQANCSQRHN
jgi:hypothetical protein